MPANVFEGPREGAASPPGLGFGGEDVEEQLIRGSHSKHVAPADELAEGN